MEHFGQSGAGKILGNRSVRDFRLGRCLSTDCWHVLRSCHLSNGISVPGNVTEVLVSFLGRWRERKGLGFSSLGDSFVPLSEISL